MTAPRLAIAWAAAVLASTTAAAAQSAPLTLETAIASALRRSPDLQAPADAIKTAAIQHRLAASQFGVKIAPNFSIGRLAGGSEARESGLSLTKRLSTGARLSVSLSQYSLGAGPSSGDAGYTVGISQPLLRGFRETATAELKDAARASQSASRRYAASRGALVVRVAAQYAAVLKQQQLVDAGAQAVDRARALRVASEARTRVGLATELDVVRAQVFESQMAASLASARAALAAAQDQLALQMGDAVGSVATIQPLPAEAGETLAGLPGDESALVDMAVRSRVEVTEARDRIQDATRAAQVARWSQLPALSLDLSYTQRGLGSPYGESLNAALGGWRVGLGSTYSLDRAGETARYETAAIETEAARREAQQVHERIAAEVRRIYQAWRTASATIAIHQQGVDLAERQLRLAQLRFERGLAGSLEVVDAQQSLLLARNALSAALLDRAVHAIDLQRAAGALDPSRFER